MNLNRWSALRSTPRVITVIFLLISACSPEAPAMDADKALRIIKSQAAWTQLTVGMTKKEVVTLLGRPDSTSALTGTRGTFIKWVYTVEDYDSQNREYVTLQGTVTFKSGWFGDKVSAWSPPLER